jgi:hypothetical protein
VLSARKITQHDKRFFEARRLVQIASLTAAPGSEAAIIIPKIDDLKIVSELSPWPRGFGLPRTIQWEPGSEAVIYAAQSE